MKKKRDVTCPYAACGGDGRRTATRDAPLEIDVWRVAGNQALTLSASFRAKSNERKHLRAG